MSTESLIWLAQLFLKNNYFEFKERKNKNKKQKQEEGTTKGAKFAPPYAMILMVALEECSDPLVKKTFAVCVGNE